MKNRLGIFKLLSDETRVRMLMILDRKELCVCQLMGVLGISQPLVSRNLSLLDKGGFLEDRREGKLIFYKVRGKLDAMTEKVMEVLRDMFAGEELIQEDLNTLSECTEFQRKMGKCDMDTFNKFMERRKRSLSKRRSSV